MQTRSKLRRARDTGYLDLRGGDAEALNAHGAWCWRLRLPLVWIERHSRYSGYGRVRLDLFTTGKQLTAQGQAALQALAPWAAEVSRYDGVWSRVPLRDLSNLASRVVRATVRAENCESARLRWVEVPRRPPAKIIEMEAPCSISA
jgi:hypothetical protein